MGLQATSEPGAKAHAQLTYRIVFSRREQCSGEYWYRLAREGIGVSSARFA